MSTHKRGSTKVAAKASPTGPVYLLRLYVTGATAGSMRAIRNLRTICEEYIPGGYELEVVDIYQQPELAVHYDLLAAPTLIKQLPEPVQRMIGDLSDREKVLCGLGLRKAV